MNVVTDPVALANELRPVLLRLARQLRRELHELDLTAGQASVLAVIGKYPGLGPGKLADHEGVSRPRMSKVVSELCAAGLVASEREGTDRRRVGLELTAQGKTVVQSIRRRRTALLASRLQGLTPDELERVEAVVPLLAKLLEEPE